MLAEPRPLAFPAAHADVDVVALRKRPGIAARNGAEVEQGSAAEAILVVPVRDVSLERDAVPSAVEKPERANGEPVDPVGSDHHLRARGGSVEANGGGAVLELERGRAHAVAELGARLDRLLGQMRVEPAALGHQHERPVAAALEAPAVAETEVDPLDHVLDHRVDRNRQLAHRAVGQPAAAGLVAWKALAVEQQHARARARETERGRRAGRPGPDHDRVEPLHAA